MATKSSRPPYGSGRQALLDAIVRLVANSGLRSLTYRALAAEASVSHGTVTHHFASLEEALEEALGESVQREITVSSLEPGTGQVEDIASGLAAAVDDDPDNTAFQFELALESRRHHELAPDIRKLYMTYQEAAQRELGRIGLDEDPALARLVIAALDGLVFQQLVNASTAADTDAALEWLREILGLLKNARLDSVSST